MKNSKAIVLLSGGLDSQIALAVALDQGYEVHAISFDYGQKHRKEIEAARLIANQNNVALKLVKLSLNDVAQSSLTNENIQIEKGQLQKLHIPNTYVPARNMIFLSVAASFAETIAANCIFIGVSQVDYSGYVDCRQSFLDAMELAINQGTVCAVMDNRPIKIIAPFINKTKKEEILIGTKLAVDFSLSWSCYHGKEKPCKTCDSCLLRIKAFKEAGIIDPSYNF